MEILLVTCTLGLFNIFGMAAASDEHLQHQGITAQQLNAEIPHQQKQRTSLLEVLRGTDNASAQQQKESDKSALELAVN